MDETSDAPGEDQTQFGFERVPTAAKSARVKRVFDAVSPRYDLMNDLMSAGLHRLWKRFAVDLLKLRPGHTTAPGDGFHLAFAAPTRTAVLEFHQAALAAGGQDNGGAGLNPEYGPDYFAAFVIDPDGYRIEAVITHGSP